MNSRIIVISSIIIIVIGITIAFGISTPENLDDVDLTPTQNPSESQDEENPKKTYTLKLTESVGMKSGP